MDELVDSGSTGCNESEGSTQTFASRSNVNTRAITPLPCDALPRTLSNVARRDSKAMLNSSGRKKADQTNSKTRKEAKILIRTAEGKLKKEILLNVTLQKPDTHEKIEGKALLDCGATGLFMDKKFAEEKGFTLQTLEFPIKVRNVDGTWNKGGEITHETSVVLEYDYHEERLTFEICDLGKNDMILGMTWLNKHNPEIDWETGHVKMTRCPRSCGRHAKEYK